MTGKASVVSQEIASKDKNTRKLNDSFIKVDRPHALLITNHGFAGPEFPAGVPDSGGQITYVNILARELVKMGFKVTTATRAFTPEQQYLPFGDRKGVAFMKDIPLSRYAYIPGLSDSFVLKEQIYAELPTIGHNLAQFIAEEAKIVNKEPWDYIAWINSHYVDGGVIGQILVREWQKAYLNQWISKRLNISSEEIVKAITKPDVEQNPIINNITQLMMDESATVKKLNQELNALNKHAWTPHSLGKLKEKNMLAMDEETRKTELFKIRLASMSFPIREHLERCLVSEKALQDTNEALIPESPPAAVLVTTSAEITENLELLGTPKDKPVINFPPGTDTKAYHPRKSVNDPEMQDLFRYLDGIIPTDIMEGLRHNPQEFNIIVDAGRMDRTKRKEISVQAMPNLPENTLLFITGKRDKSGVFDDLKRKIEELGLEKRAFLLGMVPDGLMGPLMSLPHGDNKDQFRLAIGVSSSRMEGWGMAAMDMTAGGLPLVASPLVPYATYLEGKDEGSVTIVPLGEDEPKEYGSAYKKFIENLSSARAQAKKSQELAQAFDWPELVKNFAHELSKQFHLTI